MKWRLHKIIVAYCCIITGCNEPSVTRLEQALQASGSNRAELEKVLQHYSEDPKDSLKLKAAVFLIENMPGHWGPDSSSIADYKARIDTLGDISPEERKILMCLPAEHPELCPGMNKAEDLHTLKAADLIRHIDRQMDIREKYSWLKDQDFGLFCDYLLPYRIANEWVEFTPISISPDLKECLEFANNNYQNCHNSVYTIADHIQQQSVLNTHFTHQDTSLKKYTKLPKNLCRLTIAQLKSIGIPVVMDYVPISRMNESNSEWHIIADSRLPLKSALKIENISTGKVYRRTFSINPCPVVEDKEYIPPFFRNPFQQDVTDLYLHTTDISLTLEMPRGIRYAYLAMYDGENWQPIAYSEAKGGKCVFKKIGKNCVYMPVCYPESKMHSLAPPFILRSTTAIEPLTAPADTTTTLRIERLLPYFGKRKYYYGTMTNACITCADNQKFENPDTVFIVEEIPNYRLHSIHPKRIDARRYWQLHIPRGYCALAELHFLDRHGAELRGKYIAKDTSNSAAWTDNNPLTMKAIQPSVIIDFGKAVEVAEIRYMQANDGYNIRTGNVYELFYYETGKWESAGLQTAKDQCVTFEGVPANRLFRLQDKTGGQKSNPFTWDGKRVRFW